MVFLFQAAPTVSHIKNLTDHRDCSPETSTKQLLFYYYFLKLNDGNFVFFPFLIEFYGSVKNEANNFAPIVYNCKNENRQTNPKPSYLLYMSRKGPVVG